MNNQKIEVYGKGDGLGQNKGNIVEIRIEEIDVVKIKGFDKIPDYCSEYCLPHPVVVERDDEYFLISGALSFQVHPGELEQKIRCMVYELNDSSDEMVALEKLALYVRPAGGTASAAEIIYGAACFKKMITNSTSLKNVFAHGGARRGAGVIGMESVSKLLSENLGKSIKTCENYLYLGDFISLDCLAKLAEHKMPKRFFESTLFRKNNLIESLQGEEKDKIIERVSQHMMERLEHELNPPKEIHEQESVVTGEDKAAVKNNVVSEQKVATSPVLTDSNSDSSKQIQKTVECSSPNSGIQENCEEDKNHEEPTSGNDKEEAADDIYEEVKNIGQSLTELGEKKTDLGILINEIQNHIQKLLSLLTNVIPDSVVKEQGFFG